jgi:hypothetical protein
MQFKKHAILLAVIECLLRHGSWTGKTHVQKALSLLRDSCRMSVPFHFVLYKHGPYSFEVEAELEQLQSYGGITVEPNEHGYGVVLQPGAMAGFVRAMEPLAPNELQAIESVCEFVGGRNVAELERLATASWIRSQEGKSEPAEVAERLHSLKPHIPIADAERADSVVSEWLTRRSNGA